MKKKMRGTALLAALALALGLAACGGSDGSSSSAAMSTAPAAAPAGGVESYNLENGWAVADNDGPAAEATELQESGQTAVSGRKIIYTAYLELESTDFPDTCTRLLQAAAQAGGYVESSSQSGSAQNENRWAQYTFRIPSQNYNAFLTDAENTGSALYKSEDTQDVTTTYVDVEARLSSLESQRDRLLDLEERAETLEDLLAIEEQLTQVQYQIESYTGQKKALDDQIGSSTVSVSVQEVAVFTPTQNGFMARLGAAFAGGWRGFGRGVQDFVIALAGGLPWLLLLAAVVVLIAVGAKKRARRPKKPDPWARKKKAAAGLEPAPTAAPQEELRETKAPDEP